MTMMLPQAYEVSKLDSRKSGQNLKKKLKILQKQTASTRKNRTT